MILVLDASSVLGLLRRDRRDLSRRLGEAVEAGGVTPVAPHLMWSEATSVLHHMQFRGLLGRDEARRRLDALEGFPVRPERPSDLRRRAWSIADRLGWGRTYDAEYCALAELTHGTLATSDARLIRGAADRLPYVRPLDEVLAAL
ncbi:MAG: type II toxin-antitoxin system VapC family toxin [Actinomycetota bacterium]